MKKQVFIVRLEKDAGKLPTRILLVSVFAVGLLYLVGCSTDSVEDPVAISRTAAMAPPASETITLPDGSEYQVTYASHTGNEWCYVVTEKAGAKDLSHLVLGIACHVEGGTIIGTGGSEGPADEIGGAGPKWEVDTDFSSGTFCFTLSENYLEVPGGVNISVKVGGYSGSASLPGPSCTPHDQGGGGY